MTQPDDRWDRRFAEFAQLGIQQRLRLLADLGLTDEDISTAFPATAARSVRRWRVEASSAKVRARRWDVIDDIGALASAHFAGDAPRSPDVLVHWLRTRNRELDEQRPLQCIAEGDSGFRRARAALDRDLLA